LHSVGGTPAGQRRHSVVPRSPDRIAGGVRVIRPPFPARSLTQHATQAQEDKHRKRQKDDGVDVEVDVEHVSHAQGSRDAAGPKDPAYLGNQRRRRSVLPYLSTRPH